MSKNMTSLPNRTTPRRNRLGAVLILMCLCTCGASASHVPSPFEDVPRGDPAYKGLQLLFKAGIVHQPSICFPSGRGYKYDQDHRALTRYEFAVATQRAMAMVQSRQNKAHRKPTAQESAFQTAVNKLAVEFRYELAQLNRK